MSETQTTSTACTHTPAAPHAAGAPLECSCTYNGEEIPDCAYCLALDDMIDAISDSVSGRSAVQVQHTENRERVFRQEPGVEVEQDLESGGLVFTGMHGNWRVELVGAPPRSEDGPEPFSPNEPLMDLRGVAR